MIANSKQILSTAEVVQLPLNFGVIRLDHSLTLANAHKLGDYACGQSVETLIDSMLADISKGFERFHRGKYQARLSTLLANLFYASGNGKGVLYDRMSSKRDSVVIKSIDYLLEVGLIASMVQPSNDKGCCSYVIALPELVSLLKSHNVKITNDEESFDPLIIRDKNKRKMSTLQLRRNKRIYGDLIGAVKMHNDYWNDNRVTLNTKPVLPFLHRVFNTSHSLGGRFYGDYQNSPKVDRARFLFNGKPTVELDYSSLHIAMLYAWSGVALIGDPYTIKGFDRDAVKSIFLHLVNTKDLASLKRMITTSATAKAKEQAKAYKKARHEFEIRASKGLKASKPVKPNIVKYHIKNIPGGFKAKAFIEALLERHGAIKHLLGSDDIGLKLQRADSELVSNLLTNLYSRKKPIPVLPVHDSLICRRTNLETVKLAMEQEFESLFNAKIRVK